MRLEALRGARTFWILDSGLGLNMQVTIMTIETLLKQPEGKTLDFKQDISSPRGFMKTLVAFANTAGGRVIIGVEEQAVRLWASPIPWTRRSGFAA
ncbi:MAG: putative DNA binding domain-containing protein [Deltaproteobacteria bacterium]|nr:putative DNA binding domain-containing protein [Deltaproteobacteria bacterium]